jgi:CubicO group peptidase (beta-lactamase class C family)
MQPRLALLALLPPLTACVSAPRPVVSPGPASRSDETARHIANIERGIFPGARIEGDSGETLAQRMAVHHVHGLSIAVFHDFQIVWAKGYGLADVESGAPVTDATLFQAGSISKPVAAMAALRKVQDGRIALDVGINDALRSWKLPDNDLTRASPVTLRELLSHTAGVTVHGFPGYAAGVPLPTLVQVLDGRPPANTEPIRVDLAPGTKFRYSGGGITIMQQALMDVEGKPFPQILSETVLGPVGMNHSTYEQPLPTDWVRDAAAGYDAQGDPIVGKRHVYPEMAAAGLWTTPTDLARFAIELGLEASGRSTRVLSQATARTMLTKAMPTPEADNDVGLGIFLSRHGGVTYFGHGGADEGFQAELLASATTGDGVALMTNSDDGDALMSEMIPSVAAEYGWEGFPAAAKLVTLAPTRLAELAGSYQVHADRIVHLTVEGDHLALRTPFLAPAPLLPVSDSVFVRRDDPTRYTFSRAADGSVQVEIDPPPGDWPIGKRVADSFTVPLDDVAAGRLDQAAERYRAAHARDPNDFTFSEERLNSIGARALFRGDSAGALLLFRLNVAMYPDSMNAYDSLAEAYKRSGETAEAIAGYRGSLSAFARDKQLPGAYKDQLRKNAIDKLRQLGAGP